MIKFTFRSSLVIISVVKVRDDVYCKGALCLQGSRGGRMQWCMQVLDAEHAATQSFSRLRFLAGPEYPPACTKEIWSQLYAQYDAAKSEGFRLQIHGGDLALHTPELVRPHTMKLHSDDRKLLEDFPSSSKWIPFSGAHMGFALPSPARTPSEGGDGSDATCARVGSAMDLPELLSGFSLMTLCTPPSIVAARPNVWPPIFAGGEDFQHLSPQFT
jgi:hypothetical protein